jgi:hypothetical protein
MINDHGQFSTIRLSCRVNAGFVFLRLLYLAHGLCTSVLHDNDPEKTMGFVT